MKKEEGDNTPEEKPEPIQPALPVEEEVVEEKDPELAKWEEEHKTPEDRFKAYQTLSKQYSDSSSEGKKLADERENITKERDEAKAFSDSMTKELNEVLDSNPALRTQFESAYQGLNTPAPEQTSLPDEDKKLLEEIKSNRESDMKAQYDSFIDDHKDDFDSDEQRERVINRAATLYKSAALDRKGAKYTVPTALAESLVSEKPELANSQNETLANMEQRDSASEPGDLPSGSSSTGDTDLTPDQKEIVRKSGTTEKGYKEALERIKRKTPE